MKRKGIFIRKKIKKTRKKVLKKILKKIFKKRKQSSALEWPIPFMLGWSLIFFWLPLKSSISSFLLMLGIFKFGTRIKYPDTKPSLKRDWKGMSWISFKKCVKKWFRSRGLKRKKKLKTLVKSWTSCLSARLRKSLQSSLISWISIRILSIREEDKNISAKPKLASCLRHPLEIIP